MMKPSQSQSQSQSQSESRPQSRSHWQCHWQIPVANTATLSWLCLLLLLPSSRQFETGRFKTMGNTRHNKYICYNVGKKEY